MAETVPYVAAPGSIKTALQKIADAATPERVTVDFIQTVLGIKGGTGAAIPPFLKKIGMVASDGSPTDLYKKYRNKTTAGAAIAEAIRIGYKKLKEKNEYFYRLGDEELKALIVEVTGGVQDGSVVDLTFRTLKNLKSYANFDKPVEINPLTIAAVQPEDGQGKHKESLQTRGLGLNLSYTINLNLPATSDQAVFNAIFRSLKEFLITDVEG